MGGGVIEEVDEYGKKWLRVGPLLTELPDPDVSMETLNDNIAKLLVDMKPLFAGGIPEVGLPPLEPFYVDRFNLSRKAGSTKLMSINCAATDLKLSGLSKFYNDSFILDAAKKQLEFSVQIREVFVEGNYSMKGKILFVPVKGNGNYSIDLGDLKGTGVCHLRVVGEIVDVDTIDWVLEIGKIDVNLKSLFKESQFLNSFANKIINEASQLLYMEIQPEIQAKVEEIVVVIANSVLRVLPYLTIYLK